MKLFNNPSFKYKLFKYFVYINKFISCQIHKTHLKKVI